MPNFNQFKMSLGVRFHAKYIIFRQDIHILLKKASFLAIFTTVIGTRAGADSNENEPEPESLSLVVKMSQNPNPEAIPRLESPQL